MAATESHADRRTNEDKSSRRLSASQLALARSRAYGLLSQLYLTGVTAENLGQVQAVPELSVELAAPFDADEAAADHQHLFGFNVHPYQSYFLDPSGLLGGPVTERVAQAYQNLGFQPDASSESADHIGFELAFLAFLCVAEAQALDDGRPEVARQLGDHQLSFVTAHLLPWIGPLTLAVDQQGQGFYSALAQVTFDLAAEHASALATQLGEPPASGPTLPPAPAILESEETGLREIVDFLLTPSYSGIYLSRDDIGRLARQQSIPRGFGDRGQLLLNLLRSAATYDALGPVIDNLEGLVNRWLAGYDGMMGQGILEPFIAAWRARAQGTAAALRQMHGRVEALE